jgi:hypothetical protein
MPASRRLAMLHAVESHQTPKTRVNGLESSVEVEGVSEGDVVEMVVQRREGRTSTYLLPEGSTSLPVSEDWQAYFFRKIAGPAPKPTTISVVLMT